MKKFFDKLRRWLIRRLGGCPDVFQPPVVHLDTRRIEKIEVASVMQHWQLALAYRGVRSVTEVAQEQIARAIAEELIKRELVILREDVYSPMRDAMTLRATLFVTEPSADDLPPDLGFVAGGDSDV